jgi:hypothetical protein
MLDGFDEITSSYKETVIDLVQAPSQTAVDQICVTTRTHLREKLEENILQLSYIIGPLSEENLIHFVKHCVV